MDSEQDNSIEEVDGPPPEPPTPFTLFFRHKQAEMKAANADVTFAEVNQVATSEWDTLDPVAKNQFVMQAEQEKEAYKQEVAEYEIVFEPEDASSPIAASEEEQVEATTPAVQNQAETSQDGDEDIVWDDGGGDSQENGVTDEDQVDKSVPAVAPRCSRFGCVNPTQLNMEWDNEFCSADCVVKHCRFVFESYFAVGKNS